MIRPKKKKKNYLADIRKVRYLSTLHSQSQKEQQITCHNPVKKDQCKYFTVYCRHVYVICKITGRQIPPIGKIMYTVGTVIYTV